MFIHQILRALAIVKLNSYIAILASPKYKNCSTIVKAWLKILALELQYAAIFG